MRGLGMRFVVAGLAGLAVGMLAACSSGGGGSAAAAPSSVTSGSASGGASSSQAASSVPDASTSIYGATKGSSSSSSSNSPSASRSPSSTPTAPSSATKPGAPPPTGAKWDYQIGGAYAPASGVRVVSRDSSASPAAGVYNICYINAFQAQPDATGWWQSNHPDLLLHASDGSLVMDTNWNEALLDISTDTKRAKLADIEYAWIDACAHKGFQAIEGDNLDSYSRSNGLLTADQSAALATLLVRRAHADGLAFGQKNTTELLSRAKQIGFDFAVAEQCGTYGECGQYADAFANHVVDVEYDDQGFAAACRGWGSRVSIVRRDVDVSPAGSGKYVFKTC